MHPHREEQHGKTHNVFYVLIAGTYTFTIGDTKPGNTHTVVFVPFPSQDSLLETPMPVLAPNPNRNLGKQNVIPVTLKAGYVYDIRKQEGRCEIHETLQAQIAELDNPILFNNFRFVKEQLPESAFKEGFGPYPLADGSKP